MEEKMKRNETGAPDRAGAAGRGREAAGNVARMREVLERIARFTSAWVDAGIMEPEMARCIFVNCDSALAAPLRNCDLYATEDAAFSAWAQKTGALKGHVGVEAYYQYLRWLFNTATPEK